MYHCVWAAHRVSRNGDDGHVRGCVLGDDEIVRFLYVRSLIACGQRAKAAWEQHTWHIFVRVVCACVLALQLSKLSIWASGEDARQQHSSCIFVDARNVLVVQLDASDDELHCCHLYQFCLAMGFVFVVR